MISFSLVKRFVKLIGLRIKAYQPVVVGQFYRVDGMSVPAVSLIMDEFTV